MKPEWRRFAPLGLYLALLAALAAGGIYVVLREWGLPLQISLGLVVIGLALFALLDPERTRQMLTGRQARYGSNALVLSLAFVGILVVVNYLVYQNPKRWDLTEDKVNTLAPETIETLSRMQQPVKAQAFFTGRLSTDNARSLLDQYRFNSQGNFDYEFIDPEAQPLLAQAANITRDGTIVLSMGDQQQQVTMVSERELTGALVRLISPEARTVYFLTGHGEYDPDGSGERSYAQVKRTLESKNYTVSSLNLLVNNQIPADATLIVIAGPRKPVSQGEVDLLDQYLQGGGALIAMQEPLPLTEFGDEPDPLADYLSQTWGIFYGQDLILDVTSQQPFAPFAAQYGTHPITEKMNRLTSVFPTARSVQATGAVEGVSQVQLVLTGDNSWAETDLANLDAEVGFNEGADQPGPISMAVAAEHFTTGARLVVFGDSDFVADANFPAYGNGDLFANSVDWAAGQEELISLTPKDSTQRLMVPPQAWTMNLILLGSVFILPGLVLLAGIVVWVQKRRRG